MLFTSFTHVYHTRTVFRSKQLPFKGFLRGKIKNERCDAWAL